MEMLLNGYICKDDDYIPDRCINCSFAEPNDAYMIDFNCTLFPKKLLRHETAYNGRPDWCIYGENKYDDV